LGYFEVISLFICKIICSICFWGFVVSFLFFIPYKFHTTAVCHVYCQLWTKISFSNLGLGLRQEIWFTGSVGYNAIKTALLAWIKTDIPSLLKTTSFKQPYPHSRITANFGLNSRGVKFANFQVLRETIALCPSILIELCFLSNWDEAEYLSENSKLKALAFSILNSLIKSSEL